MFDSRPPTAPRASTGLTVLELVAILVIIGILAGVAISSFTRHREGAYLAAMRDELGDVAAAQQSYFAAHHAFARDLTALGVRERTDVAVTLGAASSTGWNATARHRGTPTACTIWVGDARLPAGSSGVPTCGAPAPERAP